MEQSGPVTVTFGRCYYTVQLFGHCMALLFMIQLFGDCTETMWQYHLETMWYYYLGTAVFVGCHDELLFERFMTLFGNDLGSYEGYMAVQVEN